MSEKAEDYPDMLQEIANMSFVNKDSYDFVCESCGFCSDVCEYGVNYRDTGSFEPPSKDYLEICCQCKEPFRL